MENIEYNSIGLKYKDTNNIVWEIVDELYAYFKPTNQHGTIGGVIYKLKNSNGVSEIFCLYTGAFCKPIKENGRDVYAPSGGNLVSIVEETNKTKNIKVEIIPTDYDGGDGNYIRMFVNVFHTAGYTLDEIKKEVAEEFNKKYPSGKIVERNYAADMFFSEPVDSFLKCLRNWKKEELLPGFFRTSDSSTVEGSCDESDEPEEEE